MRVRVVLLVVLLLTVVAADAATRRRCVQTCGPRIEADCGDLKGRRLRRCRERIVRECRRTSLDACAPPTTTSTTTTSTTSPDVSSSTVTTTSTNYTFPPSPCGNGVIDPGEVCDGAALGDGYCIQGGPVTCLPSCLGWSYNACFHCGNGIREGLEECDGADIGDAVCPEGSTGGSPLCKPTCDLDDTPCVLCGDGNLDPGEFCDDGNHDAHDGCSPTCGDECGDGDVEWPWESCDDGGRVTGDGCSSFCEIESQYAGGGEEQADVCALVWGAAASAPVGATLTCHDGEAPCDRGPADDQSCRFQLYFCVNSPSFNVLCTWMGVSRIELVGASLAEPAQLDPAQQTAVLDAFAAQLERWSDSTMTGADPVRDATPTVTTSYLCGQFELDVTTGTSKVVAVRATDGAMPPHVDDDALTLDCAS